MTLTQIIALVAAVSVLSWTIRFMVLRGVSRKKKKFKPPVPINNSNPGRYNTTGPLLIRLPKLG